MRILYFLAIKIYVGLIRVASIFNPKAKKWILGRKSPLPENTDQRPLIFHCASLGEFEQAVPVMQELQHSLPKLPLWVSFFSPSGYEHAQLPEFIDQKIYLPADSPNKMGQFLDRSKARAIVCVKYEIWPELIIQAKKNSIPVALIAANFRADQIYFKPWGYWFGKRVKELASIGHQFPKSLELGKTLNKNNYLMGDTRFARAIDTANSPWQDSVVEEFCHNEKVLVLGSCWEPELQLLYDSIEYINFKIIIAPHRTDERFIREIEIKLSGQCFRHSNGFDPTKNILIIDGIGKLKYLYRFAFLAFIGGGYKNQLHNIIEALAYEIPVCFGPSHQKFPEAQRAIEAGCGFEVHNTDDLLEVCKKVYSSDLAGQNAKLLLSENREASKIATQKITDMLS